MLKRNLPLTLSLTLLKDDAVDYLTRFSWEQQRFPLRKNLNELSEMISSVRPLHILNTPPSHFTRHFNLNGDVQGHSKSDSCFSPPNALLHASSRAPRRLLQAHAPQECDDLTIPGQFVTDAHNLRF